MSHTPPVRRAAGPGHLPGMKDSTTPQKTNAPQKANRWELRTCGRRGHATYRPDEPELAKRLSAPTAAGEVWRCLRCGDFVLGAPHVGGRADEAPLILRGRALRSAIILRLLAVERLLRAVLLGLAVWAVLKFQDAHDAIASAVDRDLPALRQVGIRVDQFALVQDLEKALNQAPSRYTLVASLLTAYALLELVEGVGLWLQKRWGEYFAAVATAIFLPLEIRELTKGITFTRGIAFVINVAAVVYLLLSKHLFGLRGGRAAYDRERRGEQLLEVERSAVGSDSSAGPAEQRAVPLQGSQRVQ